MLLLTTIGRKSGQPRNVVLPFQRHGEGFVVIASNAGEPGDPKWWLNLSSNPDATVTIGSQKRRVRAREADGEERERLWARAVEAEPSYSEYERRVSRRIPVVVLEPAD